MISVIIPSCNEIFLARTIEDILTKARGEIEVIAVLDGYLPEEPIVVHPKDNQKMIWLHIPKNGGMRNAINVAASRAEGEYLMKCDAHCMFAEGFDQVLQADMEDNWIVIPSRYSLDADNWAIEDNRKPRRDYHYLCYPRLGKDHDDGLHGVEWWERGRERLDPKYDIDETMSFQGSCWFMKKTWFTDFLGAMDEDSYGTFAQEPQEIGLKTWLGGGKVMTNKKTWYAHLHKGRRYGRMYSIDKSDIVKGHNFSATYWMSNAWPNRIHDMSWFIERFYPVPTWPEDRSLWTEDGRRRALNG